MDIIDEGKAVVQLLDQRWHEQKVDKVAVLRLDLIHPVISGNKWYKLKHNIQYAIDNGIDRIVTFGGAYSNHLVAAAAAARQYKLKATGLVRGKYAENNLTPTLKECLANGMELHFLSREEYEQKNNPDFFDSLFRELNGSFIIPEGGANDYGIEGVADIAHFIPDDYTHICVAVGTGTTFVGLVNALREEKSVYGFIPMKQGRYLQGDLEKKIMPGHRKWQLLDNWHFGGFGKYDASLLRFMNVFYEQNNIPLDMVYTSKMMYGLQQMILSGMLSPNAKILCIHSGGLQGNNSICDKLVY